MTAGDFDADRRDDLAVGVPVESVDTAVALAGEVQVLPGGPSGLTGAGSQTWREGGAGVPGRAEPGDFFGEVLAAGDFDADGRFDLAVGAMNEAVGDQDQAGAVAVLYGAPGSGLAGSGSQVWTQDSPHVGGTAEGGDLFGETLAAGDLDGDGRDDLAVGASGEAIGSAAAAGLVVVLEGSADGLIGSGGQIWYQGHGGVPGTPRAGDGFGSALAAGNFGAGRADDLAVGAPFEAVTTVPAAGVVQVLYGVAGEGLGGDGVQLWSQGSAGVPSDPEAEDGFGAALG